MKILLIGTHGQFNWGDEILLETFLRRLGPHNRYFVNSYDPEYTRKQFQEFDIAIFHTTQGWRQLVRCVFACHAVVFAGGTIIRELYSTSGRNKYSSLLMILTLIVFARVVAGKRIFLSNIGMGPVQTWTGKLLAKGILGLASFAAFRDKKSYDLGLMTGVDPNKLSHVPDAVFSNEPSFFATLNSQPANPVRIALNLNYDIKNPENWEYFVTALAADLNALYDEMEFEIAALPMQTGFNPHDDIKTLRKFKSRLDARINFVEHDPQSPQEIGGIIQNSDVVVAERLHALVIASILGKPYVALDYDPKVTALAGQFGMQDFRVDINSRFRPGEIREKIKLALKQQKEISTKLLSGSDERRKILAKYFENLRARVGIANE